MSTGNINLLVESWLISVREEAVKQLQQTGVNLALDGAEFLADAAADLSRWAKLFLSGGLTADEVKSLVLGLGELAAMKALTAAGLTAVELEKLRRQMLGTVADIVGAGLKALK